MQLNFIQVLFLTLSYAQNGWIVLDEQLNIFRHNEEIDVLIKEMDKRDLI